MSCIDIFTLSRYSLAYPTDCSQLLAILFEKRLQQLEQENRMYEMGLAMRKASISTNKEAVCSIEAVK